MSATYFLYAMLSPESINTNNIQQSMEGYFGNDTFIRQYNLIIFVAINFIYSNQTAYVFVPEPVDLE